MNKVSCIKSGLLKSKTPENLKVHMRFLVMELIMYMDLMIS